MFEPGCLPKELRDSRILHYCDMCGATKMLVPVRSGAHTCGTPTGEVSTRGVLGLPMRCGGWMVPADGSQQGKRAKMQGEIVSCYNEAHGHPETDSPT